LRKACNAYAGSEPNPFTHLQKMFMNSLVTCSWGRRTPRLNLRLSMTYLRLMKHLNWVSIKPAAHPTIISFFADFFWVGPEVVASEDERRVLHRSPR
jgi:hypothetical protein